MDYSSLSDEELFRTCADSPDSAAWTEFVRRFNKALSKAVYRILGRSGGLTAEARDEALQVIYVKIVDSGALKKFKSGPDMSAEAYLFRIATRVLIDRIKSARAKKHGAGVPTVTIEAHDHQIDGRSEGSVPMVEQQVLVAEIEQLAETEYEGKTRSRDLSVFKLYYRWGLTASEIAEIPSIGLTTKGVESVLVRLIAFLRKRVTGDPSQG